MLYHLPNIVRKTSRSRIVRSAKNIARIGEGRSAFKNLTISIDERTILVQILNKRVSMRNCIDLVQDRDYWRAHVSEVLNLQVA